MSGLESGYNTHVPTDTINPNYVHLYHTKILIILFICSPVKPTIVLPLTEESRVARILETGDVHLLLTHHKLHPIARVVVYPQGGYTTHLVCTHASRVVVELKNFTVLTPSGSHVVTVLGRPCIRCPIWVAFVSVHPI
jgi:hypothetical protein